MNQKDYYQVLELAAKASPEEIKKAYRRLALQYHPDRNKGDAAATETMKKINEAYATLSDPGKRREYDMLRERYGDLASDRFRQAHSTQDIFSGSDIDQIFEEFARTFGFRGSGDIFKEFYGSGSQSFQFRRQGQFGNAYVFYSSGPAGQPQPDTNPKPVPEVSFPGITGKLLRFFLERVTGTRFPRRGKDLQDRISVSAPMAHDGGEVDYQCRNTDGGRKLKVKIPAGLKSGQRIRLRGMGAPGRAGGQAGDLFLRVSIKTSFVRKVRRLLTFWRRSG